MPNHTLLISVGGASAPIIVSLRQNDPARAIFFVSRGSRREVSETILPRLLAEAGHIPDHEFIVTPDHQDLGASTLVLQQEVGPALRRMGVTDRPWPDLVDYTGGTKTMSSAVVWASSRYPCRFSYIGAPSPEGRNKDGLGTVMDGKEFHFLKENPWDRVAWMEARDALVLFNCGQYANASSLLSQIAQKVDDPAAKYLFKVMSEIFEGFHAWDIFDHKAAHRLLQKNLNDLQTLAETPQVHLPHLKPFYDSVRELAQVLKDIPPGKLSRQIAYDLLANAWRRAEMEKKYEDATARLYAAVEKFIQYELNNRFGVDTSNADPLRLPEAQREEYRRRYYQPLKDKIQFGLLASLELLQAFGYDFGRSFDAQKEKSLRSHLDRRNCSILAHGIQPMEKKDFENLFQDALSLMKLEKEALIEFPQFPL